MERFEVPLNRMRLLGQCLGALTFVALGVFMIRFPPRHGLWSQLMGAVAVAFFGAVGVSILFRLLRPGPAIAIDSDGILDDASGVSLGLIRWDQVAAIEEYRVQDQAFLGIVLKDVDTLVARQPFWKRRLIRANLRMGAAAVNIPQASVGIKLADLRRQIEQHRREAARRPPRMKAPREPREVER
jgi:hypothetical protein